MHKIVIINKTGGVSTLSIKGLTIDTLYKKCKFRKPDDFVKRHTWNDGDSWVSLYARNTGRAGSENKYDLQPPIDKDLYFGAMAVIRHSAKEPSNDTLKDITHVEWKGFYEKCMGGFEDLDKEEEESEEEEIPDHLKTSQGYMKDGFVVEDGEEEDDDSDAEDVPGESEGEYGTDTGEEQECTDNSDIVEYDSEVDEETSELDEEEYNYKD